MWTIDANNNIKMTKGDTPSFKINLTTTDDTGASVPYTPQDDDTIIFAVKQGTDSTDVLIEIEIPHDTMILKIPQAQTKYLALGTYIYEVSLNNDGDDFHDTFIANKTLELTTEVR